MGKINLR